MSVVLLCGGVFCPVEDCGGPIMGDCGCVIADGMETNVFERYRVRLCPREGKYGVQIPLGAWHSVAVNTSHLPCHEMHPLMAARCPNGVGIVVLTSNFPSGLNR